MPFIRRNFGCFVSERKQTALMADANLIFVLHLAIERSEMGIRMRLPQKFTNNMIQMLGSEYEDYLRSLEDKRFYGLRVNTLKISVDDFLKIAPFALRKIPWIDNGFYYDEEAKPAKHPYYYAGLYYIQEPSAMTPANVLPVEEGDCILDMCAAPGGKSTELGARLRGSGVLVTNDISNSRAKALLKNIELFGISNAYVFSEDPAKLVQYYPEYFDKIMLDAPCSGEGMFRKDSRLIKSWEKNGPEYYSAIQKQLLLCAADMLKPGGILQYSTCTFSHMEDEESIKYLLKERPDMELADVKPYSGFVSGFAYDAEEEQLCLSKTVRIWPHRMQGEGHFVALVRKKGERTTCPVLSQGSEKISSTKLPKELTEFLQDIRLPIELQTLELREHRVYAVPRQFLCAAGIRVMRSGLLLGELKKNRFEPSQALAMALRQDQYCSAVCLSSADTRVTRYLKGETIEVDENADGLSRPFGWQLVCVDGFPLGWGKLSGGVLKNKYLAGWRIQ